MEKILKGSFQHLNRIISPIKSAQKTIKALKNHSNLK